MKIKFKNIIKKILVTELTVICMFFCLYTTTYAEFNPDHIPEEEQSAVAAEYYDAVDKRVDERIHLLEQLDSTIQKSSDSDDYTHHTQVLLRKPNYYDFIDNTYAVTQLKSNYANYIRENAAAYAIAYADSHNSAYKNLGENDCTNFVSQAIAVGGVYSHINSNFNSTPPLYKNWILDSSPNYWYMVKKSRTLGLNYWQYSRTWSFVSDFRTFHKSHAAAGSQYFNGNLSSGASVSNNYVPNKTRNEYTNFEYKLRKYAQIGQVWQSGNQHSIIITKVVKFSNGYNYVWYSCHSSPRENEDIQTFFNWVYTQRGNETIHRLDFS